MKIKKNLLYSKSMYCSSCGNTLSKIDKFCSKCGANVNSTKLAFPKNRFNLLQGFTTKSDNYHAFYKDYQERYEKNGFLANGMPRDTARYILMHEYKETNVILLDQSVLSKLSKEMLDKFIERSIPVIDDIVTDFIVIGYLLRGNFQNLNDHTNFSELSDFTSPESALGYLQSLDMSEANEFGGEDKGFKISPILTGMADVSVIDTVEENMHKMYPPSKALDRSALIIFMNIGWHLARFDISRHQ